MRAIIVYESMTGTTKEAGELIAGLLSQRGWSASTSPLSNIDLQHLAEADVVIVGSWTDGVFVFGQRPAKASRLLKMPMIQGKVAAVYCTYAIDPGKTLPKLASIVRRRGGDVLGGYAIQRKQLLEGAAEFVNRLLPQIEDRSEQVEADRSDSQASSESAA